MNSDIPENTDLIREAASTTSCERQIELADHPSALVLDALSKNPYLCDHLKGRMEEIRAKIAEQLEDLPE